MQPADSLIEPRLRSVASNGDPGLGAARFAIFLGLLIFAAFPQVLLGLQTFVVRDYGFFAYPLAHYQRACFWRGEIPLWNPYSHCGIPFLAQWNTMPLYPPALIYLLFPLNWSLSFFCLLHLFWAGLGMYFLARRWTSSELGAAVAGLVFGFNGFSLNLLMWPSHIATLSWMPWVVLAVEAGWSEGGRKLLLASLVGAMQMLAGGPETILFTWLVCVAFWMRHLVLVLVSHGLPGLVRPVGRWIAVVLLVSALCAAQLLPFLDLASHSQREVGFADTRWSMPAWGWANFLVPMVFGATMKQGLFFQHGQFWTSSYYLGVGALLFALVGLRSVRNARVWILAAGAVLGLVLATGDQTSISRWVRQFVSQLSMVTYPVKFVMLAVFSIPLLAGFGAGWLQGRATERYATRRVMSFGTVLLLLIFGIVVWAWRFPLVGDDPSATVGNGLSRAGFLLVVLLLVSIQFGSASRPRLSSVSIPSGFFPLLLLTLFWFDVFTHEPQQNPTVQPWVYAPDLARTKLDMNPQPALGLSRVMLAADAETKFRELVIDNPADNFLAKRIGYFANCNLLDGVPKVNGFFSICPRECGELNSILYVSKVGFSSGLADFLSVSQITSPTNHLQWEARSSYLPLATAGQQPVFMEDTNAVLSLLSRGFDARTTVLLPPEVRSAVWVSNQAPARVIFKDFQAHRVELQVEAEAPVMVALSQTFYHRWHAYVDGRGERLLRANYAFQALQVPAGTHLVQLRYEDRPFQMGAVLSGLSLMAIVLVWFYTGRRSASRSDSTLVRYRPPTAKSAPAI